MLELVALLHQAGSDSLTRHSVVRRRTFGWSSGPGVPASSSAKEALNKAKRALLQANRMSEAMPSLPLVMALMAVQTEGRWFWCGTNLNPGVLAVLMAQTAAWIRAIHYDTRGPAHQRSKGERSRQRSKEIRLPMHQLSLEANTTS